MTSTVALGRAYEFHAMKFLNYHLNMCVRHVGGSKDEGIDLRGFWYVPSGAMRTAEVAQPYRVGGTMGRIEKLKPSLLFPKRAAGWGWDTGDKETGEIDEIGDLSEFENPRRIRVLVQCKAEHKALSSRPVREMEGVLAHFHGREAQAGPHQYDLTGRKLDRVPPPTVGIIFSRAGFSQACTVRAWRSPSPLMLVHLPGGSAINPNERDDGVGREGYGMKVLGCSWNPALLGAKGLLGGKMEIRREILPAGSSLGAVGEPKDQWRVWYKGHRLGRVGPSIEEALSKK